MKHLILLASLFLSASFNSSANEMNSACAENKSSTTCQAYLKGYIDGYLASKQNHQKQPANFDSSYAQRAFANRAGYQQDKNRQKHASCKPTEVNSDEIARYIASQNKTDNISGAINRYLKKNHPCD